MENVTEKTVESNLPQVYVGNGFAEQSNIMGYEEFIPSFTGDMTEKQSLALTLHQQIKAALQEAARQIVLSGKSIKEMKDSGLYKEFGFISFEDYTEKALGVKQRQAYTYIQIYDTYGEQYLQLNANLGVTKLQLLTALTSSEREKMMNENDLASMSVSEIKALMDDYKQVKEQLSFFEKQEKTAAKQKAGDELSAEVLAKAREIAQKELADEQAKLEATRATIEKAQTEQQESLEKTIAQKVAAETKKIQKEAKEKADKALERAKAEAKKTAEAEFKKKEEELNTKLAEEQAKTKEINIIKTDLAAKEKERIELEKKMKASGNPEFVRFQFEFDKTHAQVKELKVCYSKLDAETQKKLIEPLRMLSEALYKPDNAQPVVNEKKESPDEKKTKATKGEAA